MWILRHDSRYFSTILERTRSGGFFPVFKVFLRELAGKRLNIDVWVNGFVAIKLTMPLGLNWAQSSVLQSGTSHSGLTFSQIGKVLI
jgi:hypothetical protein